MTWIDFLSQETTLVKVKVVIALAASAMLYWEARGTRSWSTRTKQSVAAVVGVLALSSYFMFFNHPLRDYTHRWEMYHYFVGSKYAQELGYYQIYACAVVAEAELYGAQAIPPNATIRDLHDDRLIPVKVALDNPTACKSRFTPERWREYTRDIVWFRDVSGRGQWWRDMQNDHGYNPSPVWTLTGHALSALAPASRSFCKLLAGIDVLLMAGALLLMAWGFGWRAAVVSVVFWGTQEPSSFQWTGGAFLRQDWLFLSVLALTLLRKGHGFWAGAALMFSALLRVFPVLFFVGPTVVALATLVRKRRMSTAFVRLFAGGALAIALLVPPSIATAGPGAWASFAEHTYMHSTTPITNHMSLRTLFSASPQTRLAQNPSIGTLDPMKAWTERRMERLGHMRFWYWATAAGLVALFVVAVWRIRTSWIALALSPFLVIVLTDPSCYYYSVFILFAPLARATRAVEAALPGLAAVGLALASRFHWVDDKYLALATINVAFACIVVAIFVRCPLWSQRSWPRTAGVRRTRRT